MVFLALQYVTISIWELGKGHEERRRGETRRFVFEALNDRKGSWIMDVLHNKPINGLFILPVDSRSLDQFRLDAFNGVGLVIGVLEDVNSGLKMLW